MNESSALLLVGHPNVGKSVLFYHLTGSYVNVSNYPGTTVEIARAQVNFDKHLQLIDTPGVLALPSRSADEYASMRALLNEPVQTLIQVGDAKNLRRTLNFTAILAELGVPLILSLNMHDEAQARGVLIDCAALSKHLNVPVIPTVATQGIGIDKLISELKNAQAPLPFLQYDENTEKAIKEVSSLIEEQFKHPRLSGRGLAILFLGKDPEVENWLFQKNQKEYDKLLQLRQNAQEHLQQSPKKPLNTAQLSALLMRERAQACDALTQSVLTRTAQSSPLLSQKIAHYCVHPFWSVPILLGILYAIYLFVGVFGGTTLVGLLEEDFFEGILNPSISNFIENIFTEKFNLPFVTDLLVGDYGLWTMGMTYALALILPLVSTFFIAFSLLEDSGYLPRLSVITNRVFSSIGLNGRAVLPMVLGLGCVTMATLTTRILTTKRERLIATFLLVLAIPCAGQLGVVLGVLGSYSFAAVLTWLFALLVIILIAGFLASRFVPGDHVPLLTELPPMRLPVWGNVFKKTFSRLKWYLYEVIPLFLLGTLLMFVLDKTGVLPAIVSLGEPLVVDWLNLPPKASEAFVMGFLRRDFGATGLFEGNTNLSEIQAIVGMTTLTLFIPCFATVVMIIKELGMKATLILVAIVMPLAFLLGGILNSILRLFY